MNVRTREVLILNRGPFEANPDTLLLMLDDACRDDAFGRQVPQAKINILRVRTNALPQPNHGP
ncbi:hypothetical protein HZA86_00180 [Candidatus Uhrbacteria bacterium]|nr:hypothetical protein [Candidatus Uhrbacteria bacterium]